MEEFEEVDVVRVFSKVFFQEKIDCCFKHEGIINSYFANTRLPINSAKERGVVTHRYQHGCPRRVIDLSIISSATRKYACNYHRQVRKVARVQVQQPNREY